MRSAVCRATIFASILMGFVVAAIAAAGAGETSSQGPQAKCRKAEINPVTGHILCIDPLGAPVEPPPETAKPGCKPEEARGQWSYGPGCAPEPGRM
jgi:hypothetical protein